MADLLSSGSSRAELRKKLQASDRSAESDDLLSRLNALDFVSGIVGEATDIPDRLGDFRITGLLGRGGMGTVYLAWQEELEREVALKVLSQSWSADPTMRQRFRAEARAAAALHHRHIVPIYGYGEAQGCLFFAMEKVDGLSLDKLIAAARRRGARPMEPRDAARRFAGVADALGLAHRRRILHRDVKPGNILVGSDGTLALTDFGLAKALDQGSMRLTSKSGGFLGTLHYTSPEQAIGSQLTPACDLYSLGVTLFEAVSGELPLHGKTTESVLQSILYGQPRRLREVLPRPPRDLEAVLDKLLSREPRDRYQDGEELSRDLARIADGDPVHIRRQPLLLRLFRRMRKNPVLSGAIVAATVLLVVTFVLLSVLRQEKGQSLLSRHQNNLVQFANLVRAEMGEPAGPPALLACLVGGGARAAPAPPPGVQKALQSLRAEMPDDPTVEQMRLAYVEDPLPDASERLLVGSGFEALVRFDDAISNELTGTRRFADLAVDLRLYWLYLGRAVANLTASVMRPGDARRDLDLASFLRPGAVFPRALAVLLDLLETDDMAATLDQVERDLAVYGHDRAAVVARLLLTASGQQTAADANLMPFALAYADRRRLQRVAQRYCEPAGSMVPPGAPSGRAAEIEGLCAQLVARLGETTVVRALAAQLKVVAEHGLHPQSALQGCYGTAQLLERPTSSAPLVGGGGQSLTPTQQLLAWDVLHRIAPPAALVEKLLPRFEVLHADHPELAGMRAVAAQLHLAARSPRARALANAWVVDEPESPLALHCRLQSALREGDLAQAVDDAMAMVQQAADPGAAIESFLRDCEAAAGALSSPQRDGLAELAGRFRGLLR